MKRIRRIAALVDTSRGSGRQFIRGIARYSASWGPWEILTKPIRYYHYGAGGSYDWLRDEQIDGLIARDPEDLDKLAELALPMVVSSTEKEQYTQSPSVITDSAAIAALAAEHLLNCGITRFAYCGLEGLSWSDLRLESFRQAILGAGYEVYVHRQVAGASSSRAESERSLASWLSSLPKPVGVMACNDDRAMEVVEACRFANIRVPDQVAVVGVDNDLLVCNLCYPQISSVSLNFERAGYEAAAVLEKLIQYKKPAFEPIKVEPTHVAKRQSTDILAIQDPEVARAIRYIRKNANEPIQVSDVANSVSITRRALEKRFRKLFDRTINDEIARVRVESICKMLRLTNFSIGQIALALGYTSPDHIARYFKKQMGMPPLTYRKRVSAGE